MAKEVIKVGGMSCAHCVKAVTEAALGLAGVSKADVNLKKGTAKVTFDEGAVTADAVKAAIREAGYEA